MICKIMHYPKDEAEKYREHVFECTDFYLNYLNENKVEIHTSPQTITGEINPESTEVYLMNDSGKTINSYRWTIVDGKLKVR